MSRIFIPMLALLLAACTGPADDQEEEEHLASSYQDAVEKARDARSDAEAAMEKARQEIEDNEPPD